MKKFLVALLVMLGIHAMADDINLWQKSTLNSILQKGVLTVGLEPGYMPFEMKDKQVILSVLMLTWLTKWQKLWALNLNLFQPLGMALLLAF